MSGPSDGTPFCCCWVPIGDRWVIDVEIALTWAAQVYHKAIGAICRLSLTKMGFGGTWLWAAVHRRGGAVTGARVDATRPYHRLQAPTRFSGKKRASSFAHARSSTLAVSGPPIRNKARGMTELGCFLCPRRTSGSPRHGPKTAKTVAAAIGGPTSGITLWQPRSTATSLQHM